MLNLSHSQNQSMCLLTLQTSLVLFEIINSHRAFKDVDRTMNELWHTKVEKWEKFWIYGGGRGPNLPVYVWEPETLLLPPYRGWSTFQEWPTWILWKVYMLANVCRPIWILKANTVIQPECNFTLLEPLLWSCCAFCSLALKWNCVEQWHTDTCIDISAHPPS